eukprot:GGOE01046844.1.p1 GENE.GGOE01046844.1~~GGOE01046844.1.p1  ORF type:complete len:363 (-),score=108.10 GGOE01046844.1:805-1866(-)
MSAAAVELPCLAVVAPDGVNGTQCVIGNVVVDRHLKYVAVLHDQLRFMTIIRTADRRNLCITSHIADGMWASVYSVREDSGRPSAMKVIPVEGANVDSAHSEVSLLRRLDHPNIVQYYSHFTTRVRGVRCLFVQVEFCDRGTLADLIRTKAQKQKSPMSASRIQDFTTQLASALAYIHDQGILHGDLRPENVLVVGEKEQLKLSGFGSPLWMERRGLRPRTVSGGCKTYAAPEWMHTSAPHRKLESGETPPPSYDMWSLGCVLSELLTLKLLRHNRRYVRCSLAADPSGLQSIAQEVAATHSGLFSPLLGRLLETDPDARITATEALHMLQAIQPLNLFRRVSVLCRPFISTS